MVSALLVCLNSTEMEGIDGQQLTLEHGIELRYLHLECEQNFGETCRPFNDHCHDV